MEEKMNSIKYFLELLKFILKLKNILIIKLYQPVLLNWHISLFP